MDLPPVGARAPAAVPLRVQNVLAGAFVALLAAVVYDVAPWNRAIVAKTYGTFPWTFTGSQYLFAVTALYIAIFGAWFLLEPQPGVSRTLRCLRTLARSAAAPRATWRAGLERADRLSLLVTLLKAFYAPMMAVSLMSFLNGAAHNGAALLDRMTVVSARTLFDTWGFWFAFQLIVFVDVLVFTIAYLVELPRLGNRIRSVDPTLLGWAVALACYPPFNQVTAKILGSPLGDQPSFTDPLVHFGLNAALLIFTAVYAWCSVALGFRAGNLAHRGIVARGPYRVVRHPAYVCKNLSWWIYSVPFLQSAFALSAWEGVQAVASVAGWAMIYVLRAVTEEDHLRSVDGEYEAYAAKVRWRFIPGLI